MILIAKDYLRRYGIRDYMMSEEIMDERLRRCRNRWLKGSYIDEFRKVWKELGWE